MASLFELLFRLLEAGLDGSLDLRMQRDGALRRAYRAHTLPFCMAAVLLCWLPHLAVSYPASMNSDTQSQFDQILGLLPWSKASPDASGVLPVGDDPAGACAGQRKCGLVCLCAGAGGLCGGGDRVQPVDHAQALRADLAAGAFACAVRFCAGVLRQHHGDPQGCSLQLRDAADALRDGSTALSGKGRRRVQRGVCAPHDPVRVFDASDARTARWSDSDLRGAVLGMRGRKRRAAIAAGCGASTFLGAGFDAAFDARFHPQAASLGEALSLPFQQTARFVSEYASEVTDEERAAIDGCWFTTSWQNTISRRFPTR